MGHLPPLLRITSFCLHVACLFVFIDISYMDTDSGLSVRSTEFSKNHSTSAAALREVSSTVCPICDHSSRTVLALWQHINAEHISRRTFPPAEFLAGHNRHVCCICGFAYDKTWKVCRRSTVASETQTLSRK